MDPEELDYAATEPTGYAYSRPPVKVESAQTQEFRKHVNNFSRGVLIELERTRIPKRAIELLPAATQMGVIFAKRYRSNLLRHDAHEQYRLRNGMLEGLLAYFRAGLKDGYNNEFNKSLSIRVKTGTLHNLYRAAFALAQGQSFTQGRVSVRSNPSNKRKQWRDAYRTQRKLSQDQLQRNYKPSRLHEYTPEGSSRVIMDLLDDKPTRTNPAGMARRFFIMAKTAGKILYWTGQLFSPDKASAKIYQSKSTARQRAMLLLPQLPAIIEKLIVGQPGEKH